MKAAVLDSFGSSLCVREVPNPVLGTGEVIVDVVAAPVASYTDQVISGERRYLLELPATLGCGAVGRVRAVGPDATRLKPGDWVLADPTVRSRDAIGEPDILLQGWSARGAGGLQLQRYFRDGPFAEQIRVPTENAVALGDIDPARANHWCALGLALVPYSGLLAANLVAGETLLISGATGNFGAAAVAVALAMGAGCVVAPGRNAVVLADLVRRFGDRVRPVQLSGDPDAHRAAMTQAAPGPIDCVLDILPPEVPASVVRSAIMTVRPGGRVVLMGGVGMLGGEELALPYPWIMRNLVTVRGQWMYDRATVSKFVALTRSGLFDLAGYSIVGFGLDRVSEAVAHAASNSGAFKLTVLEPGSSGAADRDARSPVGIGVAPPSQRRFE